MTDSYTKLFSSITESTIVCEPVPTRWLWVVMLAMCNSCGEVFSSVPGLARRANLSREETEKGLATFLAPDPDSRTKDHDGRRIEEIDGGWRLLNHAKYSAMRSPQERAEYKREWDRKHRPSGHQRSAQSDSSPTQSDTVRHSPTKSDSPTPLALTPTQAKSRKAKATACAERSVDHSPPAVLIPLVDGSEGAITERQAAEFATAYPGVDVPEQLRRMRAWALANPKNRKTRAGLARFANAWLAKCQDANPRARAGPPVAMSKTGAAFLALGEIANGYTNDSQLGLVIHGDCARLPALDRSEP